MRSMGQVGGAAAGIPATSPAFLAKGAVGGGHKSTRDRSVAGVGAERSSASRDDGARWRSRE
jgi:hypothetical protein